MNGSYRAQLTWLLLIAALILLAGIGMRDPWPADEPRFALIAKDMVLGGNWLIPHVGSVVYPDKPPLFFWLVAAFFSMTGSLKVAILLPGVIAGLGALWLVADLGRRLWGPTAGIASAAVLLALVQFPLQMKSGQIDGVLCFWTTLGLYGFCRHLLLGPDWRWYALGGVAAGLGVITKGVGFLPYLVLLPWALAVARGWPVTRTNGWNLRWLLAPLGSVAVIALWLVPMLLIVAASGDPELAAYRDNILLHQTVDRYANAWGHLKPAWYLFTNAVPGLWLPATALLPWLVPAWYRDLRQRNSATLLLGSWVLLVLLFFTMSMGKRSLYIFPAAPALALIVGQHMESLLRRVNVRRMVLAVPVVFGALLAGYSMYLLMNPRVGARLLGDVSTLLHVAVPALAIGIAILMTLAVSRKHVVTGFAVSVTVFWVGLGLFIYPPMNSMRSGRIITEAVADMTTAEQPIAFVNWPEQFLLQWPRPVTHFGFRRQPDDEIADASAWLAANPAGKVLLPAQLAGDCVDVSRTERVGFAHRREWVLAGYDALTGDCGQAGKPPLRIVYYEPDVHDRSTGFSDSALLH